MKKRTVLPTLLLCFSLLILQNCATSTMTTAKTTPEGKVDLMASATFLPEASEDDGFIPEIGFRIGVSKRLDLGLRLFGMGFLGEAKLGIIQSERGLNLALQGGLGYSFFIIPIYSYEFGAIASIDTQYIAPYASVKIRRFGISTSGDSAEALDNIIGEFMIIAAGICLFPESKVSLFGEFNWFESVKVFGATASGRSQALVTGGIRLRI